MDTNKLNDISNKIVTKCEVRYHEYQDYLTSKFYKDLEEELPTYYNKESGISPDIYLMIIADKLILKKLGEIARNGEIDIEISLIEKYSNLLYFIMKRMGYTYEEYEKYGEDILIKAIETYDGEKTFTVHIVKCIREFKTKEHKSECYEDTTDIKENFIEQEQTIVDKVVNYLKQNDIKKRTPNYLETLCHHVNIVDVTSDDNSSWKEFLYLKYGFYKDIYFTLEEISIILNIDIEEIRQYYRNSLLLLKQITDQCIIRINACDIEFKTSKNFVLKN